MSLHLIDHATKSRFLVTFRTIYENEWIDAVLITASYTGAYAEKDFTNYPAISFPLYSAYQYKAGSFQQILDSNAVLLETRPLEFEVSKFNCFQEDRTLCIFFKDMLPEPFCKKNTEPAMQIRRTPKEAILADFISKTLETQEIQSIEQAIFQLLDSLFAHRERVTFVTTSKLPFSIQRIDQAKAFIYEHFSDDIGITDIASCVHLSPFHFSRVFKKCTGYAPYDYLLLVRIEYAKTSLESGKDITETAFNTGFNSLENFSYTFKKITGFSPSQFQKSKISKVFFSTI